MKILSSSTFFPFEFYHRDFDFDDSIKQPCFHRGSCVRTMNWIMYIDAKKKVSVLSFVFSPRSRDFDHIISF